MSKVAHISSLQKRTNSLLSNERIHELGSCLIIYDLHFLEIDFAFGFFTEHMRDHGVKSICKKKKRKLAGFPESFAFVRLGRGQILPHSLLMTVGHYLCSLLEGILNEARHVISETQPLII